MAANRSVVSRFGDRPRAVDSRAFRSSRRCCTAQLLSPVSLRERRAPRDERRPPPLAGGGLQQGPPAGLSRPRAGVSPTTAADNKRSCRVGSTLRYAN